MAQQVDTGYIDANNNPQDNKDEILKQAYKEAVDKIASVQKSTGKALTQMKLKVYKEVIAKYDALKKFTEEVEKMASARESVDWALTQLKTKDYKATLAKNGVKLMPADFYLGLVRKESGFNQQAESNKEGKKDKDGNMSQARGLFQLLIKTDSAGNESSITIDDINKFFELEATAGSIYFRGDNNAARKTAANNNALLGILYWHTSRDRYAQKLKPDWSADDKDKLGNMIYNMGIGSVINLSKEMDLVDKNDKYDKAPGNFKELITKLSKKLHDAYPDDLENKEETVVDPVLGVSYTSYLKIGKNFDKEGKEINLNGKNVSLGKIFEAIKYAELVFSLNHGQPQQKVTAAARVAPTPVPATVPAVAPATSKAPASVPAPVAENASATPYVIGENGKWFWGIAKDIHEKQTIDDVVKSPEWSNKTKKDKIDVIMAAIFSHNKLIKNPGFTDIEEDNIDLLKKGTKVFEPPRDYILKYVINSIPKTPASAPEKYTRVGPTHILKGQTLGIIDSFMPSILTIDTSGVKEKIEFKQVMNRSTEDKSDKKFEHDQIQVKVGNLIGFFQMEGHKNLSYGPFPFDKGGLWDKYSIHFDKEANVIKIATSKPLEKTPKPLPEIREKPKTKDYIDPDQPIDLSWPEGEKRRIPKGGEAIYIGLDGKSLAIEGAKLHQINEVPEPVYATPDWLDPDKGTSKEDKVWDEMGEINGVVLHATEGTQGRGSELFKKQNTHFLVRRNGEIWQVRNTQYQTNHTGFFDSSYGAIWDGNKSPANDKIGIEVETLAYEEMVSGRLISLPVHVDKNKKLNIGTGHDKKGNPFLYTTNEPLQSDINTAWEKAGKLRSYNEEEYQSLSTLLKYLAFTNQIKKQDIITHSMLGSGENGRGRKTDPCNLDFKKLDLPDNYRRIDPDVARGTLPSMEVRIEGERKGIYLDRTRVGGQLVYKVIRSGNEYHYLPSSGFGGQSYMNAGLRGAQDLCEDLGKCKDAKDPSQIKLEGAAYGMSDTELSNRLKQGQFMVDNGLGAVEDFIEHIKIDSNMTAFEAIKHKISKECPAEIINNQSLVDVLYYSFDNKVHKGQIVIHKKLVKDIQQIFALAYEMKFPIGKVIPISNPNYNWDDIKSVTDNNSSSFNYREIAGSDSLSDHAEGRAIDINPLINPFIDKKGKATPGKAVYNPNVPGTLTADHPIVKKFLALGWEWGGNWNGTKDYQHFSKKP